LISLSDICVITIDGQTRNLGSFLGKATLVVNVASQCGFTPQYTGLEALYRRFRDRGLAVLGFPCDQFGHQEPGNADEIKRFCTLNYRVDFPLFAKIEVNGPNAHPLYRELKAAAPGFLGTERVKWNFTKFLLGGDGKVIKRYSPMTKPEALSAQIDALLERDNPRHG
jgi:glutathione peroxidase